eukprot:g44581.t1
MVNSVLHSETCKLFSAAFGEQSRVLANINLPSLQLQVQLVIKGDNRVAEQKTRSGIADQAAFIAHPELSRGQLGVNHIAESLETHEGQISGHWPMYNLRPIVLNAMSKYLGKRLDQMLTDQQQLQNTRGEVKMYLLHKVAGEPDKHGTLRRGPAKMLPLVEHEEHLKLPHLSKIPRTIPCCDTSAGSYPEDYLVIILYSN